MSSTGTIVGSGKFVYEVDEDWAKLPDGWTMPAAAVTVDSQDRVYCFNRTSDHPVIVFDLPSFLGRRPVRVPAHDPRRRARQPLAGRSRSRTVMYVTIDGTVLRTIGVKGFARTPVSIPASRARPPTGR